VWIGVYLGLGHGVMAAVEHVLQAILDGWAELDRSVVAALSLTCANVVRFHPPTTGTNITKMAVPPTSRKPGQYTRSAPCVGCGSQPDLEITAHGCRSGGSIDGAHPSYHQLP
jgi:hypothetical protein